MGSQRVERVNELLQREIASGLYHLKGVPDLDLARITVAAVSCSPDLRQARVFISVLEDPGGEARVESVLRSLNRCRRELQHYVAGKVVLKYFPHLDFQADTGQAAADRVYRILDSLPPPANEDPPAHDPPAH